MFSHIKRKTAGCLQRPCGLLDMLSWERTMRRSAVDEIMHSKQSDEFDVDTWNVFEC